MEQHIHPAIYTQINKKAIMIYFEKNNARILLHNFFVLHCVPNIFKKKENYTKPDSKQS